MVTAAPEGPEGAVQVSAHIGAASSNSSTLAVTSSNAPVLLAPAVETAAPGSTVAFTVKAVEADKAPVTVSASDLPAGATFDAISGSFSWVPAQQDAGSHIVTFTAANPVGATTQKSVQIDVESGLPMLSRLQNAAAPSAVSACTPGSAAALVGSSLSAGGQAQVLINGEDATVLQASPEKVTFVCPTADPGSPLSIVVQTSAGASQPLLTIMQDVAPGLMLLPVGQNQALAYIEGSFQVAAVPNFEFGGGPAQAGDTVSFLATGIRCDGTTPAQAALVDFGAGAPVIGSIHPEYAGMCRIQALVPAGLPAGRTPVTLQVSGTNGTPVASNTAFIDVD